MQEKFRQFTGIEHIPEIGWFAIAFAIALLANVGVRLYLWRRASNDPSYREELQKRSHVNVVVKYLVLLFGALVILPQFLGIEPFVSVEPFGQFRQIAKIIAFALLALILARYLVLYRASGDFFYYNVTLTYLAVFVLFFIMFF